MLDDTKLDITRLRDELRERIAALAAAGHALPYRDGGKVAFTRSGEDQAGKAA